MAAIINKPYIRFTFLFLLILGAFLYLNILFANNSETYTSLDPAVAKWTLKPSVCGDEKTCKTFLSGMPCLDEELPPEYPNSCRYVRIASCFPKLLKKCLSNKLSPNKWIMILGDSVTKYAMTRFITQSMKGEYEPLKMSPLRKNAYTPGVQHDNDEYLLFGQFLVTNTFLGGAGGDLTPNNIRTTFNLTLDERRSIYERTKEYARQNKDNTTNNNNTSNSNSNNNNRKDVDSGLPFGRPDIVIINSGLWDARSSSKSYYPNYVNSMHMWRNLLEGELGMETDKIYWRSTTPVHPNLHSRDISRKNMTLERIQELNSLAYDILVEQGDWHYINGYNLVSPDPSNLQQAAATITFDGYHPNGATLCNLMDVTFASLCEKELSHDDDDDDDDRNQKTN